VDVDGLDRVKEDLVVVVDAAEAVDVDVALAVEGLELADDAHVGVDPARGAREA